MNPWNVFAPSQYAAEDVFLSFLFFPPQEEREEEDAEAIQVYISL